MADPVVPPVSWDEPTASRPWARSRWAFWWRWTGSILVYSVLAIGLTIAIGWATAGSSDPLINLSLGILVGGYVLARLQTRLLRDHLGRAPTWLPVTAGWYGLFAALTAAGLTVPAGRVHTVIELLWFLALRASYPVLQWWFVLRRELRRAVAWPFAITATAMLGLVFVQARIELGVPYGDVGALFESVLLVAVPGTVMVWVLSDRRVLPAADRSA